MKKIMLLFITFFLTCYVYANDKVEVTLNKCIDGDTAWFIENDELIKVRFLAIDSPESTIKKQPFGKEASDFTCKILKNALTIEIEYDPNSDKVDKYDRKLAWIFIDGELLQYKIVKNGYAQVAYIYGNYKYTESLYEAQKYASSNKLNIWSQETDTTTIIYIVTIGIITIYILMPKNRKLIEKNIKKYEKKLIKRR